MEKVWSFAIMVGAVLVAIYVASAIGIIEAKPKAV